MLWSFVILYYFCVITHDPIITVQMYVYTHCSVGCLKMTVGNQKCVSFIASKRCIDLTAERAFLRSEWLLCSAIWHDEKAVISNVLEELWLEQTRDPFKRCPESSTSALKKWEHRHPYESSMPGCFPSKCLARWKNYTGLEFDTHSCVFSVFYWYYSWSWTLTSHTSALHWSQCWELRFKFLAPIIFRSSSTESIHLTPGLPMYVVPSGL